MALFFSLKLGRDCDYLRLVAGHLCYGNTQLRDRYLKRHLAHEPHRLGTKLLQIWKTGPEIASVQVATYTTVCPMHTLAHLVGKNGINDGM